MNKPGSADVVWLNAPGKLKICREPLPALRPNDLLCSTLVSAISPGTELAAYKGLPPLRPGVIYPRLQGYCNVAQVTAIGPEVMGFAPGDRVLSFMSHRSAFVLPQDQVLYKLPDSADANQLACTYLFHLGYNAILRSAVRAGSRVLVIGLGALGLTTVAASALAGATTFALSDQSASAAIAARFGAQATVARAELPELEKALGPGLADVVVVTTNSWADWNSALRLAAQRGTIAVLGFPGRGEESPTTNPLDSQYFYMKQLRIEAVGMSPELPDSRGFGRFNERANLDYLAQQIMSGRLDPSPLISGRFKGQDIVQAYEMLLVRRSSAITCVLQWHKV
ncbi:zinc-binding alcohol dehydrogenase [Laribacter hongkongensis]|uniref:zinc-dependent alcohol dehydrogenase n=1 Tax=Laribacter hongkongensis TaxID=168471 RepID=UPI001EFCA15B|nr:zinc-binding alcohol dehydrogenase [Laribacter hongkongensis]MCG9051762.1 zinc-binding alcohol dehydrogenase [Laribacter hongkongensis]